MNSIYLRNNLAEGAQAPNLSVVNMSRELIGVWIDL